MAVGRRFGMVVEGEEATSGKTEASLEAVWTEVHNPHTAGVSVQNDDGDECWPERRRRI